MATILTVLPPWVFAQSERTGSATAPASAPDSTGIVAEAPVVSLLTCAPGELVYELEGHTGLRFRTSTTDIVVNWGLFDFNSPGFIYRFVRGETDYTVGAAPTEWFLNQYRNQGRSVTEQVLNLTPTEALRLQQLVADNMQNNPVYRYNYVKDNCSLRPLRLIEKALAPDSIHFTDTVAAGTTFRSMMTDFHRSYPWYQFGIDLALGSGIDYRITTAEAAFAPVTLQKLAASAIITTPDGNRRFVSATETIVAGTPGGVALPPTPWYLTPVFFAYVLLTLTIAVTLFDIARRRVSRLFDALMFGIYGIAGCVIAFLVFISSHEATSPNLIILWLNPFCLLVPLCLWSRRGRNFLICYHFINFAAVLALIIVAGISGQRLNHAFLPLMAADMIRSAAYIFNTLWEQKRKKRRNAYQIRYSGSYSSR